MKGSIIIKYVHEYKSIFKEKKQLKILGVLNSAPKKGLKNTKNRLQNEKSTIFGSRQALSTIDGFKLL